MVAIHRKQLLTQVALHGLQHFYISFRIKTAYARPVPRKANLCATCGWHQYQPNVDELVFYCIRRIAKHKKPALLFVGHYCTSSFFAAAFVAMSAPQAGKGCRVELRNAVISSRTLLLRATICSTSV